MLMILFMQDGKRENLLKIFCFIVHVLAKKSMNSLQIIIVKFLGGFIIAVLLIQKLFYRLSMYTRN